MNAQETATILGLFAASYPTANVTEQTSLVWASELVGIDPRDGLGAARSMIRSQKWFPSLAEFIEAVQVAIRLRTGRVEGEPNPATVRELDEVPMSREQALDNVSRLKAQMRQMIETQKQYEHRHGKHGVCPVPGCPSVTVRENEEF